MRKRSKNFLIELLLVFFALANLAVFSTAKGYYGSNTLYVIRVMPAQRHRASQLLRNMGAEWAREEFNWQTLNPRQGRYDLANADQAVATYRRNGVKVVGMIAYSSLWGSSHPEAGTDAQFYKPNITHWKNFISLLVRRYGNYVKDWEIWNEPNAFWKPAASPEEYREVLMAAYDTIKSIDPSARVGSGGVSWIDGDYISRFLNDGGWEHLDAISIHYYPGAVGPESRHDYKLRDELWKLVFNIMIPRGGGKEIWITEMGWQSHEIGEQAQAEVISRAIILARTINEVSKTFIYNLRDDAGHTYGLMSNKFGLKPSYNAYKKTIEALGSKRISQWFDLDNESKFYIFNDAAGAVAAAWNPNGNQITGFHVNASGMRCYDLEGRDVSGAVILAWNNGDATLNFGPRPIFCHLDNYWIAEQSPQPKYIAKVAGVNNLSQNIEVQTTTPHVLGEVYGQFSNRQLANSQVKVYQEVNSNWRPYLSQNVGFSGYDLSLPEGRYYLSIKAPGHLSARTKPFEVDQDTNVNFQTTLFNSYLAYIVLAGGVLVLGLLIFKYSYSKKKR